MEQKKKPSKFGDHPNSIIQNIHRMSPEQRARFYRNQARAKQDYVSMELWAAGSFLSGIQQTDNYSTWGKEDDDD